jgi:cytochrome c
MLQRFQTAGLLMAVAVLTFTIPNPAVAGGSGKDLASKSDCFACHAIGANDPKKMGPNYGTVANKYAGDKKAADMLTTIIRKGGTGHWGAMAMPPHAAMTDADAKTIATWVLSLKSAKAAKPAAKPATP